MSTTRSDATLDVSATEPIPFARLVRVEWRKMLDTRGGFWLLLITGVLLLIAVGLVLLVVALEDQSVSANTVSQVLTIPLSLLLPIFPILTVTTEWSQRSGLVTFALEPHRLRVLLAKFSAVVIFALATIAVAIVVGALTTVIAAMITSTDVRWELQVDTLLLLVASQLLYFTMAFGFAMTFLNTPGAIAVFYVVALMLPVMVYSILYAVFDWAQSLIPWIDLQYAFAPFLDPNDAVAGLDVARLLTAVLLWVVAPLALGLARVLRTELK